MYCLFPYGMSAGVSEQQSDSMFDTLCVWCAHHVVCGVQEATMFTHMRRLMQYLCLITPLMASDWLVVMSLSVWVDVTVSMGRCHCQYG